MIQWSLIKSWSVNMPKPPQLLKLNGNIRYQKYYGSCYE